MRLKRHYATPPDWVKQVNTRDPQTGALINPALGDGACLNPPPLEYIEIQHTGTTPDQHFSVDLVATGLSEGWLSIQAGVLTLHGKPEDLHYRILRTPGKYASRAEASGYEVIHYYDCLLDEAQHDTYCAKTEPDRREAAYLLQGITPKRKAHVKEVPRG